MNKVNLKLNQIKNQLILIYVYAEMIHKESNGVFVRLIDIFSHYMLSNGANVARYYTSIQPFSITTSTDTDQDDQQVLFNFVPAQISVDELSK